MNGEKQNPQVKLHFDVMDGGSESNTAVQAKKPGSEPIKPKQEHQAPPAPPEMPGVTEPGGHNLISKIAVTVIVLGILGLGGYYGYQWFSGKSGTGEENLGQAQNTPPEPQLPGQWLVQYFGSEQCEDTTACGANADPDGDGLRNVQEVDVSTSPLLADTDNDGITDNDEIVIYNTDPIVADTDSDNYEDGIEIRNNYSPVINSGDPATTIEKQLWEENISKNGLNEFTKTFLSLKPYISSFIVSTSVPQIYLGYPADFIVRESYDEGQVQFENPDDQLSAVLITLVLLEKNVSSTTQEFIDNDIVALEQEYGSANIKQETLPAGDAQLQLVTLETLEKGDNALTRQVGYLPARDTHVYRVIFEAPEKNWDQLQTLAYTVMAGSRNWPF